MSVSYKKLFKMLIDRDMKKKDFRECVGISYSTLKQIAKRREHNCRSAGENMPQARLWD